MAIAPAHRQIASKAESELGTIGELAGKTKLSGTEERRLNAALRGLMAKTSEHLENFEYPVAGNIRSLSIKFRKQFGTGPYDIEQREDGRFAAVAGRLGSPVALASILSALPVSRAKAGMLVFPDHNATTLTLGRNTGTGLRSQHENTHRKGTGRTKRT